MRNQDQFRDEINTALDVDSVKKLTEVELLLDILVKINKNLVIIARNTARIP